MNFKKFFDLINAKNPNIIKLMSVMEQLESIK